MLNLTTSKLVLGVFFSSHSLPWSFLKHVNKGFSLREGYDYLSNMFLSPTIFPPLRKEIFKPQTEQPECEAVTLKEDERRSRVAAA